MKRIDLIFNKLKELNDPIGNSAIEIADALYLDRSNVSRALNQLNNENKVVKIKGKPVLFRIAKEKTEKTVLEVFAADNTHLKHLVDKAITAVLYPPNGMNMLILGEKELDSSMFAELIYEHTVEIKLKKDNAPFIGFNCATYANNQALLISKLFGYKKEWHIEVGLVEKANNGVLFLDEVNQLSAEGQEMLLAFMESGTYKRQGEIDKKRRADVLIICSSNSTPSLLTSFVKGIPMIIQSPTLKEHALKERSCLVR